MIVTKVASNRYAPGIAPYMQGFDSRPRVDERG